MAKNSYRIAMVISQFYPLLSGAEVQAQRLASNLIKRGNNVFVLTRKRKGLPNYEEIEGIPVYREIRIIKLPFLWGACYILSVFVFLCKRRKDYDIIHCHIVQEYQSIVAVLIKYMFNKKIIVKMSSSGETSDLKVLKKGKLGRFFLRWVRHVDIIISVCKKASVEILKNGFSEKSLMEIPNGVDIKKYSQSAITDKKGIRNITYIGRLDKYKGVNFLLTGFKELLLKIDDVRLIIIGTGPDELLLKQMTRDLKIQKNVTFKGRSEDILIELHDTDIFVLPSLSEGMSNVLLEAMASGLPIVATHVGGNGDVIKDGYNGILIPPRDTKKLTASLVKLLEDENLARSMGAEARKTVEKNYSMSNVVDKYVALYSQLVS